MMKVEYSLDASQRSAVRILSLPLASLAVMVVARSIGREKQLGPRREAAFSLWTQPSLPKRQSPP
jgi:hypothetical protein